MKKVMQRAALFGFLGCVVMIAIASQGNSHTTCAEEWKGSFQMQDQVAAHKQGNDGHWHQSHQNKKLNKSGN